MANSERTKGRRTRRRLLDAAETVFGELGYREASVVRIVERAGVAQGTFYIYFRSKMQIFEEVVDDLNLRMRDAMSKAAARGSTRFEAERLGFEAFFRFSVDNPGLYRIIREAEVVSPSASQRHYERIVAGYAPRLEQAMEAGEVAACDPAVLAWALVAIGEMIGKRYLVWEGGGKLSDEIFEECMRIVGRMLGVPSEG